MGQNSQIQWTDATWNVARGCTKVSEGCKYCYMMRDSMDSTRYNPAEIKKHAAALQLVNKLNERRQQYLRLYGYEGLKKLEPYKAALQQYMTKTGITNQLEALLKYLQELDAKGNCGDFTVLFFTTAALEIINPTNQ